MQKLASPHVKMSGTAASVQKQASPHENGLWKRRKHFEKLSCKGILPLQTSEHLLLHLSHKKPWEGRNERSGRSPEESCRHSETIEKIEADPLVDLPIVYASFFFSLALVSFSFIASTHSVTASSNVLALRSMMSSSPGTWI